MGGCLGGLRLLPPAQCPPCFFKGDSCAIPYTSLISPDPLLGLTLLLHNQSAKGGQPWVTYTGL